MYSVKETFYTLQGEGAQAGRPSVFCRFTGCNLWSGREQDRATSICTFCDTDFIGTDGQNGGKFKTARDLADHIAAFWPSPEGTPYVVFTGGEPLLQLDAPLIEAMHAKGFEIAVETNGTIKAPNGIDWLCVSPKGRAELVQETGHELKLVYPQPEALPERFEHTHFEHYYLQPMDLSPQGEARSTLKAALDYCMKRPRWKLSLQTHKMIGID
ncbi:7-carboxy-7-deazaguanine synthase [Larsenimonas suaedae]|uniref:7-carboxy-7-deazaguanine synthase n=1 Tax=Larsenimonas suaedae TaxID=1851019 RepID=A0ABU1GTQ3_9GAMM|nr:7-carboxy-7-deazaguanine synthase [Larsenimonas suaedae]MCM2971658.1 7-carboxy-7-deazaguanine synthase [Larsenimonas suaedae]MDR5895210.1 7-carboxy-7-deazaguanine synthase [Larsenimonas suaedae]